MKIFKYELPVEDYFELELPAGAKILTVQTQFELNLHPPERPKIWVLVDPSAEKEKRKFRIIGTGKNFNENGMVYLGTFQQFGGALIWHLFELKK